MKEKKLYIGIYNDYYGALLSGKLSEMVSMYYDEDMSMGEIAKEFGITPQAVKDSLDRAEKQLCKYEQKLSLVSKNEQVIEMLKALEIDKDNKEKVARIIEVLNG